MIRLLKIMLVMFVLVLLPCELFAQSLDDGTTDDEAMVVAEGAAADDGEDGSAAEEAGASLGTALAESLLNTQLREVGTRVDLLKEDTFTTKSRLLLLREEVLQRSVNGARLLILHRNEMGGQYELVSVTYSLDRQPKFSRFEGDGGGRLNQLNDEVVFDGMLSPGTHELTVQFVFKGRTWGVFRYMTDYTFVVESGYSFVVGEGKAAELVVTAVEQGNFFTAYEDRPSVSYSLRQFDLVPQRSSTESGLEVSNSATASDGQS
ncbi:MAG: hypothetical protein FWC40_09725 [Proteobacteria bacterium]|nr:hypothetical protein [Pseudomonadota bacterium]